ncbi:MAG TPA: membrane dipeptidase [Polyangiaceae bacterium]|nr:membrane dipeptidase [Polyangiaceae bacterium]
MQQGSPQNSIREAPEEWAQWLGISREAAQIYAQSDVIDLHLDSFIWSRILGYDIQKPHRGGLLGRWFLGHADLPRVIEAGITGATWVITTNPLRADLERAQAFRDNLLGLAKILQGGAESPTALVRTRAEYQAARTQGLHAAFIGVQGGNAVDADLAALDAAGPQTVLRVTMLHLTRSSLGLPSTPFRFGPDTGLTDAGRDYVQALNDRKIFVDLAHISRQGFNDAFEIHDKSQPLLVSHTGVSGVFAHWRNLDDQQLRRIADTGGTIGVMYHAAYLGGGLFGAKAATVFRHIEHIVNVVGDDHASLGSDWDGAIVPPSDLSTCSDLPRLVQIMLDHNWRSDRIQKILGLNFLRTLQELRG